MNRIFIFSIAILGMFTSCTKEDNFQPREQDCPNFTDSQIDSIGILHNEFLDQVYIPSMQSYQKDPNKRRELIKFMAWHSDMVIIFTPSQRDSLIGYSDNLYSRILISTDSTLQYVNWKNAPYSEIAGKYFIAIQNAANNAEYYDQFVSSVNNFVAKANRDSSLTCQELQAIKVTASVAKNSAYLWMPVSMGGQGWFDTYNPPVQGKKKWSWKMAMAGDLTAATACCFEVAAVGAMTGGIALGPMIVGAAVSCGMGSAFAGAYVPG